jgi:ferredoxin
MNAKLYKDPTNIIITGVGGQGNVMASRVLAGMLVNAGCGVCFSICPQKAITRMEITER